MSILDEIIQEERSSSIEGQFLSKVNLILEKERSLFKTSISITDVNSIPETSKIPIENPSRWLKVKDVVCCFVDMEGSTKLSASLHSNSTAKCYRFFTETAIRIFASFDSPYIDIKGDGVFALFDSHKVHTALAAIVSIKTFVQNEFISGVKRLTDKEVGGHFGIDQNTLLVRKFGLKRHGDRTDRQNEVWAGKTVNMAAKLASLSTNGELLVSDRYYKNLKENQALYSCECNGKSASLWESRDMRDDGKFDFEKAYVLNSNWCIKHGRGFCKKLIQAEL